MKKFTMAVIAFFVFNICGFAQFNTPNLDGTISANEYGNHTDGHNQQGSEDQTWYMTWDNSDLFIGISGYTSGNDAIVLYLDTEPIQPVNGGDATNGNPSGTGYDGVSPALPVRADFFAYVKAGYDAYEFANGSGSWGSQVSNSISKFYSDGNDVIEFSIPWSIIKASGRPAAFNWLGFLSYSDGGGGTFARVPTENPVGTTPTMLRYYTISSTADGSATKPFSQNSYTHIGDDYSGFGAINIFDFTMNTSDKTITRAADAGGQWNIDNDLVLGSGTINFGSSTDKAVVGGDVIISTDAALTLSTKIGGDLEVAGDFTDNGTFTNNDRRVLINGSTVQTLGGSSETTFGYFTVNPNAQLEALPTKRVTVVKNLTVVSAKDGKAAGQLTLKSDENNTASLIIKLNGTASGDINVERFLSGGWDWHFLSSPVVGQHIVGVENFIGFTFGTGGIAGDPNVDFYMHDPTVADNPWINIKNEDSTLNTSFDATFQETKGYLVAYKGASLTKKFTGIPQVGAFSAILENGSDTNQVWNLLGNPYPSAINWAAGGIDVYGLDQAYYQIYNPHANGGVGGFEYFKDWISPMSSGTNGKIPAMQGFYVKVDPDAPVKMVQFSPNALEHDNQPYFKNKFVSENLLNLKILGDTFYSEAQVFLKEGTSPGLDKDDASMLFSMNAQVPHIYSVDGSNKMVMNAVPFSDMDQTIPMGLKTGQAGSYTITAEDVNTFNTNISPILEDNQTGAQIDLRAAGSYTFDVNEPGINNSRFVLHLKNTVGINDLNSDSEIAVSIVNNELKVYNLKPGEYQARILDIMGRVVMEGTMSVENTVRVSNGIRPGAYVVQVFNTETNLSQKLVIR